MKEKETIRLPDMQRHIAQQCGNCGVWHTIPEVKYDTCYREGGFWTCPNGHTRGWEKGADHSEMETLRRERDRLKQQAAQKDDEIKAERERATQAERKLLLVKKRAIAGVCPCCQRTFQNVQRHMKSRHPNVVPLDQKTGATG